LSLADGRHIVKNFTNGGSVLTASAATCYEESAIKSKEPVRRGEKEGLQRIQLNAGQPGAAFHGPHAAYLLFARLAQTVHRFDAARGKPGVQ